MNTAVHEKGKGIISKLWHLGAPAKIAATGTLATLAILSYALSGEHGQRDAWGDLRGIAEELTNMRWHQLSWVVGGLVLAAILYNRSRRPMRRGI